MGTGGGGRGEQHKRHVVFFIAQHRQQQRPVGTGGLPRYSATLYATERADSKAKRFSLLPTNFTTRRKIRNQAFIRAENNPAKSTEGRTTGGGRQVLHPDIIPDDGECVVVACQDQRACVAFTTRSLPCPKLASLNSDSDADL